MPAIDKTNGNERRMMLPGSPFLITASDTADNTFIGRCLIVSVDGAVSVQTTEGTTVIIPYLAAGIPYPITFTRVNVTGTGTTTGIWGIA